MNEIRKTAIFIAIALVLSLLTWVTIPSLPTLSPEDMLGKQLFPDFTDPLAATSLEIVKSDDTGKTATFKVAQVDGAWSIPSHSDYPADAEDQLAEAATDVMGLEVLNVPTETPGGDDDFDVQSVHELYGLIDPSSDSSSGADGIGTLVTMCDKDDATLLSLIVGKEVDGQNGLRYVRRPGQDPVYTVAVSTDKLSTKFEDWIEADLLKLDAWDIKQVHLDDYTLDYMAGSLSPRGKMTLDYDDIGDPKWELATDQIMQPSGWTDLGLDENEELNTETLNDMKTALDDLKIVDVARKPAGLSQTLQATGEYDKDNEGAQSLMARGFYFVQVSAGGKLELRSNEGESHVLMKDGVKYILRFGQLAGSTSASSETTEEGEESTGSGVNRYLFVMAEFDDTAIAPPELETLPEPESADEDKADADEDEKADSDEEADEDAADDDEASEEDADAAEEAEEESEEDAEAAHAALEAERERIEKENQRKQDEYDEKITEGQEKVKELNQRFADWYYVISDEVYQKIHLGRDDIVQEKEAEETDSEAGATGPMSDDSGTGMDAFESLISDGLPK